MTSLAPILPKLAKLVPRLASEADGEVVATVRAIDRTLRTGGFDWHDMAGALAPALPPRPAQATASSAAAPQPQWTPQGQRQDRPRGPRGPSDGRAESQPQSWREIAHWCAERGAAALSAKERAFVLDMARELGPFRPPTEKQAKWLRAIHARLRGMQ